MAETATVEGPRPPLTARGTRTRERLITAAREIFESRGFPGTRVAHIAEHAQVAYGSFYTYFPSKEAIFLEVADRLFQDMTRFSVVPAAGPEPADRIRRANRAYYQAYLRNAGMMAVIEQVATFNVEFQELRRQHRAVSIGRSARAIRRWQQAGLIPADPDPEMTARALAAMVDHTLYLWLVQGENPPGGEDPPGTERLLDALDTLSIRALGLPITP